MKVYVVSLLVLVFGLVSTFASGKDMKVTPLDGGVPIYTAPTVEKITTVTNLSSWTDGKGGPIMIRREVLETRYSAHPLPETKKSKMRTGGVPIWTSETKVVSTEVTEDGQKAWAEQTVAVDWDVLYPKAIDPVSVPMAPPVMLAQAPQAPEDRGRWVVNLGITPVVHGYAGVRSYPSRYGYYGYNSRYYYGPEGYPTRWVPSFRSQYTIQGGWGRRSGGYVDGRYNYQYWGQANVRDGKYIMRFM